MQPRLRVEILPRQAQVVHERRSINHGGLHLRQPEGGILRRPGHRAGRVHQRLRRAEVIILI